MQSARHHSTQHGNGNAVPLERASVHQCFGGSALSCKEKLKLLPRALPRDGQRAESSTARLRHPSARAGAGRLPETPCFCQLAQRLSASKGPLTHIPAGKINPSSAFSPHAHPECNNLTRKQMGKGFSLFLQLKDLNLEAGMLPSRAKQQPCPHGA